MSPMCVRLQNCYMYKPCVKLYKGFPFFLQAFGYSYTSYYIRFLSR